jgi:vancomycin resistance protein YoaR
LSLRNPEEKTELPGQNRHSNSEPSSGKYVGRRRRRIAGPLIVACAVVAVMVMADYWVNADKVYYGVRIGDMDLGGKTPAEAERMVRERTDGALEQIRFTEGPEDISRSAEEMGVNFDVEGTVEEAYAVGREGNVVQRLRQRVDAFLGTITIPADVEYDPAVARAEVERLARELDAEPVEGTVAIEGAEVIVGESERGYETNVDGTMENVGRSVDALNGDVPVAGEVLEPEITTPEAEDAAERARTAMSGELIMVHGDEEWTVEPAEIGQALDIAPEDGEISVTLRKGGLGTFLGDMFETLSVEPREAEYVVNSPEDIAIEPGQPGRRIEDTKFFESLKTGIFEGQRRFEVPTAIDYPELTTDEAEKLKPTDLLGEYSTNYLTYDDTEGRVTNLQIAADAVNNTMLAPGEVFSFNALAEPLDYEETKVIVRGRVDEAEGGGLCQVSSTLYMAANYAGLDIVERSPHYAELPYIRPGFDATVWFGAIDMKFKNTTDGYLLIQEGVDTTTGNVYAAIYGQPTGLDVQMTSEKVNEYEDDEGNPVTEWVTYRTVSRDGEVIEDGVYHEDTYKYLKPENEDRDTG